MIRVVPQVLSLIKIRKTPVSLETWILWVTGTVEGL